MLRAWVCVCYDLHGHRRVSLASWKSLCGPCRRCPQQIVHTARCDLTTHTRRGQQQIVPPVMCDLTTYTRRCPEQIVPPVVSDLTTCTRPFITNQIVPPVMCDLTAYTRRCLVLVPSLAEVLVTSVHHQRHVPSEVELEVESAPNSHMVRRTREVDGRASRFRRQNLQEAAAPPGR